MLVQISILSSLLPIIFFVVFCLRNATRELWVIFASCVASFISDFSIIYYDWGYEHKYLLWNIYTILEYYLLIYFFYLIIKERAIRFLIILLSMVFLVLCILFSKYDTDHFNSLIGAISSVIILTLSLCFFIISLKRTAEPANFFTPIFLIVIGLLFYVAITLFLYIIANNLSTEEFHKYWAINQLANILVNLIISLAFYLYRTRRKSPPHENRSVDFTSPNDR